jgi:transcriptional regulator with XRE-family HTH domain
LINHSKNELGKRIRALRKEKKLTQVEFSKRIRRDTSTISKIESGELELSNFVKLAICNAFGVREEWLLTGKEPKYDDRRKLLEEKAKELGEDIWYWFIKMKAAYDLRREATEAVFDKKTTILTYDELSDPKLFALLRKVIRIYNDRDPKKNMAIESLLEALDPGEKKQDVGSTEDAGVGSKDSAA